MFVLRSVKTKLSPHVITVIVQAVYQTMFKVKEDKNSTVLPAEKKFVFFLGDSRQIAQYKKSSNKKQLNSIVRIQNKQDFSEQ